MPRLIKFFLSLFFLSQMGFPLVAEAQNCKYEVYSQLITKAKKEVLTKKYKKANDTFKEAFSLVDWPLGHDLSFALVSAVNDNDDDWAGSIAKRLAKGGIPLRYFMKYKKEKWYSYLKLNYEGYTSYYEKNYNLELRQKFLSLIELDKGFNEKYHQWRTKEIELTVEDLKLGAKEIYDTFIDINDNYGFPSERKMGYYYVRRINRIVHYPTEVLIIHIRQSGIYVLSDKFHEIICEGEIQWNYKNAIEKSKGFSDGGGIEKEMKMRFATYRPNN